MLTLHGFAYSNYHNIVKPALLYKGIPFTGHVVYPNTPQRLADSDISRRTDADMRDNTDEFMAYIAQRPR